MGSRAGMMPSDVMMTSDVIRVISTDNSKVSKGGLLPRIFQSQLQTLED